MPERISVGDKTSVVIDRRKIAEVKEILGTHTIADTIDAALREVIDLRKRRRIMERIRRSTTGGIGPTPGELTRLRRP